MNQTLDMMAEWRRPRASLAAVSWVQGPVWDGVWMQSALWLTPLALWLGSGHAERQGPLDALYLIITALFWLGHRFGSAWLAYATEAYRPLLAAQPVRFVLLPALVALVCFAILLPPDSAECTVYFRVLMVTVSPARMVPVPVSSASTVSPTA